MSARLQWDTDGAHWPHRTASRFVQTDALRWHVQMFQHPDGAAPVVLLLHGTGASTHSWRDVIPVLAAHCTVLAVDLPGHAFTAMPRGGTTSALFSLPGMARGLRDLLQALGTAPDWLVGHSAGAAVAVRMCLDGLVAPRAVFSVNGALAPLDGLAGKVFSPLAKALTLAPLVPELFAWRAANPVVLQRLIDGTGSQLDARGLALYRQLIANPGHAAGALGMMANWDLYTLWRDLRRLQTPLHCLVGANDRIVAPDTAWRVAALPGERPAAQVHLLAGLGHLAHEERPQQVAELLLSHIH